MEQAGRRWRRWPLLAAIITLAVVLAGRWTDYEFEQHESRLLASRTANASATAEAARATVLSTRQYTMPLLVSSSSATVRAGLAKLIDDEAAHQATLLEQARDEVRDTTILPWHHALWDRKKAEVSAINVQISALDAASHGADLQVLNALLTATPP
jgi:hypothetical protein